MEVIVPAEAGEKIRRTKEERRRKKSRCWRAVVLEMEKFSKTQIDKLGDRLRKGQISEEDLKLLDGYRKSYGLVYDKVVCAIKDKLKFNSTGRPAKSTTSIIDKLCRESIRLSQIQDIAGCRIVVDDLQSQDQIVALLEKSFLLVIVVDRRVKPSFGYRAVHVIIKLDNKLVEVQVRTELQHGWAEVSEKLSDKIDPTIKYGGGSKEIQEVMRNLSENIKFAENLERELSDLIKERDGIKKDIIRLNITDEKINKRYKELEDGMEAVLLRMGSFKQNYKEFFNFSKRVIRQERGSK